MTRQAIQLGYMPRLDVEHTSAREMGQIYVPQVNWGLMVCTIAIVIGFGSSGRLAAAYGMGVAMAMVITTVLLHVVMTRAMALAGAAGLRRDGAVRRDRRLVLRRQPAQAAARRMGQPVHRADAVHGDDDVEDWTTAGRGAVDGAGVSARGGFVAAIAATPRRECLGRPCS